MHVIGVQRVDKAPVVRLPVGHGEDPRVLLWHRGWVVSRWLSATGADEELVVTAQVRQRTATSRTPRRRGHRQDPDLVVAPGEVPTKRQRVAAYAIVRSHRGLLGTICSDRTAVPGRWQLPGGGLEASETSSQAVIREVREETDQSVALRRLVDLQSDHWVGRAPNGRLEDFQAIRIIYTAVCTAPTEPEVLDVGGTTEASHWVSLPGWRSLPWTSSARSALDRHVDELSGLFAR